MNTKLKTCGTCWHFNAEPFIDHEGTTFIGCGNDREVVTSIHPVTHFALTFRPIVANDSGCEEYLTEEDGDEQQAASWAKSEAEEPCGADEQERQITARAQLHDSEVCAERVMQQVFVKLRKGSAS